MLITKGKKLSFQELISQKQIPVSIKKTVSVYSGFFYNSSTSFENFNSLLLLSKLKKLSQFKKEKSKAVIYTNLSFSESKKEDQNLSNEEIIKKYCERLNKKVLPEINNAIDQTIKEINELFRKSGFLSCIYRKFMSRDIKNKTDFTSLLDAKNKLILMKEDLGIKLEKEPAALIGEIVENKLYDENLSFLVPENLEIFEKREVYVYSEIVGYNIEKKTLICTDFKEKRWVDIENEDFYIVYPILTLENKNVFVYVDENKNYEILNNTAYFDKTWLKKIRKEDYQYQKIDKNSSDHIVFFETKEDIIQDAEMRINFIRNSIEKFKAEI